MGRHAWSEGGVSGTLVPLLTVTETIVFGRKTGAQTPFSQLEKRSPVIVKVINRVPGPSHKL